MNSRIKELRNYLNLNQEEFGSRIGIGNTAVSKIEKGQNNVSEQVLILICKEFGVNEKWLRTGAGNMFIELPQEDEYFKAATQISKANDKLAMQVLIEYWKLDDDGKKLLKDFILHIAEKSKE